MDWEQVSSDMTTFRETNLLLDLLVRLVLSLPLLDVVRVLGIQPAAPHSGGCGRLRESSQKRLLLYELKRLFDSIVEEQGAVLFTRISKIINGVNECEIVQHVLHHGPGDIRDVIPG